MWWILQIVGAALITFAFVFNKWGAANDVSFFIRWVTFVCMEMITAPLLIISYMKAPTFFQPWFLGAACIALLGFVASLIFFGETIVILKILGAALALVGAALLIL